MGAICASLRPPPHPGLDIRMPEGVGRIDHSAVPHKVREDAVELMAISLAGNSKLKPDPLIEWLLGDKMKEFTDPRRMIIARHLARHAWEFCVESCGGFALGVKDDDGQLGGLALAMPRAPSSCITHSIERQTANYNAGKLAWDKMGEATKGLNARLKTFEKTRRERLAKLTGPHVHLSHLRVNSSAKAQVLEQKLVAAVCLYADRHHLNIYTMAAGVETWKLFTTDGAGFKEQDRFEVHATHDPDKSPVMDQMYELSRSPGTTTATRSTGAKDQLLTNMA